MRLAPTSRRQLAPALAATVLAAPLLLLRLCAALTPPRLLVASKVNEPLDKVLARQISGRRLQAQEAICGGREVLDKNAEWCDCGVDGTDCRQESSQACEQQGDQGTWMAVPCIDLMQTPDLAQYFAFTCCKFEQGAIMCGILPFNSSGYYVDPWTEETLDCPTVGAYCELQYDECGGQDDFTSLVISKYIPNTCCGAEVEITKDDCESVGCPFGCIVEFQCRTDIATSAESCAVVYNGLWCEACDCTCRSGHYPFVGDKFEGASMYCASDTAQAERCCKEKKPPLASTFPVYVIERDTCPIKTLRIESGLDCEAAAVALGYEFQVQSLPNTVYVSWSGDPGNCYLFNKTGDARRGPRDDQRRIICATAFHNSLKCSDDGFDCCVSDESESPECFGEYIPVPDPKCKFANTEICNAEQAGITCFGCFSTQAPWERPFQIERYTRYWTDNTLTSIDDRALTKVLKIGTIQTLTPKVEHLLGDGIINGLLLFLHLLAFQQGGVRVGGDTYAVELVVADDNGNPEDSDRIVKNLIEEEGIQFFIGGSNDKGTRAVADEIHNAGAVFIDPYLRNPAIIANRPSMKAMSVHPKDTFKSVISELLPDLAIRHIWVIKELDLPDTLLECSAVEDYVAQQNYESWMYTVGVRTGYTLSEVREAVAPEMIRMSDQVGGEYFGPEAIFVCVREELCDKVLNVLASESINAGLLILNECFFDGYVTDVKRYDQWAQTTSAVIQWTPMMTLAPYNKDKGDISNISVQEFVDMYILEYETTPDKLAASAFTAGAALVRAIENANSIDDPALVVGALNEMDLVDIFGKIDFDMTTGMNIDDLVTVQFQQSAFALVVSPYAARQEGHPQSLSYPKPSWASYKCFVPTYRLQKSLATFDSKSIGWDPLAGNYNICAECPKGKYGTPYYADDWLGRIFTLLRCSSVPAGMFANQIYQSKNNEVVLMHCPVGTASELATSECISCPLGRFQNETKSRTCLDCAAGTYSNILGASSCLACKASAYATLFSDQPGASTCIACPTGGLCEPDSEGLYSSVSNKLDYFAVSLDLEKDDDASTKADDDGNRSSQEFTHCWHTGVCLLKQTCLEGHSGLLCGSCEPDFQRSALNEPCQACDSIAVSFLHLFINFVLVSIYTTIIAAAMTGVATSRHLFILPALMKQVFHYLLIMRFITPIVKIKIGFFDPNAIFNWLCNICGVSALPHATLAMSCLAESFFPSMHLTKVYVYVGWATLPIYYVSDALWYFMAHYGWVFLNRLPMHEDNKYMLKRFKPNLNTLFSLLAVHTYMVHTRILLTFQTPFKCRELDELRFEGDTSTLCASPEIQDAQSVGLNGLFVFGLGLPFLLVSVLSRLHREGTLYSPGTFAVCGFLFIGLEEKFWYWEVVQQLRKFSVIQIAFVLELIFGDLKEDNAGGYEVLTLTSILFVISGFMTAHLIYQPYDNRNYMILDRVENAMYAAILMTLLGELTYSDPNPYWTAHGDGETSSRNVFITIVVTVFNLRFIFIVFWGLVGHDLFRLYMEKYYGGKVIVFTSDGLDISNLWPRGKVLVLHVMEKIVKTTSSHPAQWKVKVFQKLLYVGFAESVYWRRLKRHFGNRAHELHDKMVEDVGEVLTEVKRTTGVNYADIKDPQNLEDLIEQLQQEECMISAKEFHAGVKHAIKHQSPAQESNTNRTSKQDLMDEVSESSSQGSCSVIWGGSDADSDCESEQSEVAFIPKAIVERTDDKKIGSTGNEATEEPRGSLLSESLMSESIAKFVHKTASHLLAEVRHEAQKRVDEALPPHRFCQSSLKSYIAALGELIDSGKDEALMLASTILKSDPELLRSDSDDMIILPSLYGRPMTYNKAEHDYYDELAERYKRATSMASQVMLTHHQADEYRAQVMLMQARTTATLKLVEREDPRDINPRLFMGNGSPTQLQQCGKEPSSEWTVEDSQFISRTFYQLYSKVLANRLCERCEEAKMQVLDFLQSAVASQRGETTISRFVPFNYTRTFQSETNGKADVAQKVRIIIEISVKTGERVRDQNRVSASSLTQMVSGGNRAPGTPGGFAAGTPAGSTHSERSLFKGKDSQSSVDLDVVEHEDADCEVFRISHKATYHVATEQVAEAAATLNAKTGGNTYSDAVRSPHHDRRVRLQHAQAEVARLRADLAAEEDRVADLRGEIDFMRQVHENA